MSERGGSKDSHRLLSHKTPRIAAARRLTRRSTRAETGRFLVEGAQAVREALVRPGRVHELFLTEVAAKRHPELCALARDGEVEIAHITERAAAALSETVSPQGVLALCDTVDVGLEQALSPPVWLVAVLAGVTDPGNAGTIVRTADAAGADAVVFAGHAVDVHNGKCVRASAGSVFHLPIAHAPRLDTVLDACRAAGLRRLAADGAASHALTDDAVRAELAEPCAWVFGNENHGLDASVLDRVDAAVRVPMFGAAESLNLAGAAAVCLYASALARRDRETAPPRVARPGGCAQQAYGTIAGEPGGDDAAGEHAGGQGRGLRQRCDKRPGD